MNKRIYSGTVIAVAVILAGLFLFGVRTYNELIDMRHFLDVAHGRLLAEMERKQVILSKCRTVVAMYATMEEKIQDHMIELHRLTRTRCPQARIKSEEMEIIKLVRELDLLVEKYPGLRSKGPYVLLMETIQDTGFRVTAERLNYNNWTYNYNVLCHIFPHRIVAMATGFREQPFLHGPLHYASLN